MNAGPIGGVSGKPVGMDGEERVEVLVPDRTEGVVGRNGEKEVEDRCELSIERIDEGVRGSAYLRSSGNESNPSPGPKSGTSSESPPRSMSFAEGSGGASFEPRVEDDDARSGLKLMGAEMVGMVGSEEPREEEGRIILLARFMSDGLRLAGFGEPVKIGAVDLGDAGFFISSSALWRERPGVGLEVGVGVSVRSTTFSTGLWVIEGALPRKYDWRCQSAAMAVLITLFGTHLSHLYPGHYQHFGVAL
jgi:hypothetical protein